MNNYSCEKINNNNFVAWINLRYLLWPYHSLDELTKEAIQIYNSSDKYFVLLVKYNDEYIAMIEGSQKNKKVGFIEGIYVKEKYRCKKIATMLVQKLEQWILSWEGTIIESDTNKNFPLGVLFHEHLKFQHCKNNKYYFKKKILEK